MYFKPLVLLSTILSLISSQASDKVVVGYFTDWTLGSYPVSKVDFSKLTHINYAFALFTDQGYNPKIDTGSTLTDLVNKAHQTKTKVLVSIGGWTGSKYFSPMVANAANRALFIKNTLAFVAQYNLDGVDFDWEYPGRPGADGNIYNGADTANYLIFLKELRAQLGNSKLITAAVRSEPFDGPNGPLKDVAEFGKLFDFINLMSYDLNGSWSRTTGPLGGLDYEVGKGDPFSVKQACRDWSNAGIPKDRLVVGVPFYGFAAGVSVDMTNTDQYQPITNPNVGSYTYGSLYSRGALTSPLQANTGAGWIRKFDPITQTPWLFNKNSKIFISYDDIQSLKAKTDFVRCNGYRGNMLWALDQDYNGELLTALQNVFNSGSCDGTTPPPTSTSTQKPPTSTSVPPTTTPVPPTTTSKPTSTQVTSQPPLPTGSCTEGYYQCGQEKGPGYYQCVHGKWLSLSCPSGTVCVQSGTVIYCGYPKFLA